MQQQAHVLRRVLHHYESLPLFIGRSLHPTPAEMAAVLDY
jgi:hypothetical protein